VVKDYFETVQKLEFLVSQSLDFQFMVHGAHRALHGLILDIQQVSFDLLRGKHSLLCPFQTLRPSPSADTIRSLIEPARNNLKQSRFTDAELIYTPSQIALACLSLSSDTGKEIADKYLAEKEERAKGVTEKAKEERLGWVQKKSKLDVQEKKDVPEIIDVDAEETEDAPLGISQPILRKILSEIENLVQEKMRTAHGDVEQVKPIDKKLKLCQNPENMPNSRM
jgi:cyclin H